ncbi:ABC transporter ATP-binding protein [Cellulomonas cellasea]|uniref:ABC transporter ATP-binding protein n=1 Tax=Cellulomonas cellasea TaxID=43670 RepID=UPI0025A4A568|nr:ABC transporter ATP-binding protein [Cellulomonas cellasea]MDM8083674.1 ABC transporter ATP-binding protein [Cellulomonas cellasea]
MSGLDARTPGQAAAEGPDDGRLLVDSPARRGVGRAALQFARPHRRALVAAVALGVVASLATTLGPVVVGRLVDALLDGDRQRVILLGGAGIALSVLRLALSAASRARLARAGEHLVRDVRDAVARQLAAAPLRFIERHRAGELLQRSTAEVAELSAFVRESLTGLLVTASTVVLLVAVLASQSWLLALVLLAVFLPPSLFVLHRFRLRAAAAFGAEAQAEADVAASIAEAIRARALLSTAPAITTSRLADRLGRLNDGAVAAQMRTVVLSRWIGAMTLIEGAALAVLLAVGSSLAASGTITVGVVVTFLLASVTLFASFSDLVALVGSAEEALTGAARVQDLLGASTPRARRVVHAAPGVGGAPPAIELEDVWLGYGAQPVLAGVWLRIEDGERCGLAGRSGAGKSTIAMLMAGLGHPDRGTVRCAGRDLAGLGPEERARLVSYVPQEMVLGSGTLADELRLVAPDADDAALRGAVESLGLGRWLDSLPGGLDAPLGAASALTVGERQLVALARVALRGSAVIVLDEATSDVDPACAELVESALDRLAASRTVVVVAHRPSTLARLNRVFDVAGGQVTERAVEQAAGPAAR